MNNEEVRLECSPKLVKGHSEVNCAHPPLEWTLDVCLVSGSEHFG